MDKLTSMLVFSKVAKAGSFAAAAKELGLSRAMATKHVMQLENGLGIRLLNRTTRNLKSDGSRCGRTWSAAARFSMTWRKWNWQ